MYVKNNMDAVLSLAKSAADYVQLTGERDKLLEIKRILDEATERDRMQRHTHVGIARQVGSKRGRDEWESQYEPASVRPRLATYGSVGTKRGRESSDEEELPAMRRRLYE